MNITLTGNLGSGKSSVCNELKKMGFEIISTGTIFREIAAEKGISVVELNELAKKDRSIDDMIDNRSIKLGKELDNVVFDSRMAWNFVPDSFKVFLFVDTDEAARRVALGDNRQAENYNSIAEAAEGLLKRASLEKDRYMSLYQVDYYDASNYNLLIESTNATPENIANEIVRCFEEYKKQPFTSKVLMNVSSIYPTQSFDTFDKAAFDVAVKEEMDNATGCAKTQVLIAEKNGGFYSLGDCSKAYAALSLGKKFTEVTFDLSAATRDSIKVLSKEELEKYEAAGNFKFNSYPGVECTKYMIEF